MKNSFSEYVKNIKITEEDKKRGLELIDLMNKAQQMYIAYFIDFYIKGMETLTIKKSIIRRKKIYLIKQIFYILKNKYINNREKIIIFLFAINYKLYLCVSKYLAKGRKS